MCSDDAERKRQVEEMQASGRYVPPSMRGGPGARAGVSMTDPRGRGSQGRSQEGGGGTLS